MRIETCFASAELDGRRGGVIARLERVLPGPLSLDIVDVVLTDAAVPPGTAVELFADPVVQDIAVSPAPDDPRYSGWDWLVEIAWRPGVTDTLALTAREALEIGLGHEALEGRLVQTARLFLIRLPAGVSAGRELLERACAPLWNPLIQAATILSRADWTAGRRLPALYPGVSLHDPAEPEKIDLPSLDEAGLEELSARRLLALTLEEMAAIRAYYADPAVRASRLAAGLPAEATDVEIEMIAQTWSEHCKHKIFNAEIDYREDAAGGAAPSGATRRATIKSLFKTYIRAATEELAPRRPDLLSVFTDNAGVFRFDADTAICVKAETHNSPSALDPYGGAITGIVGVNRDILGTGRGARPLFNTDVLCFAPPSTPDGEVPQGLLPPREVLAGVHRGIVDGGNQSGIPTVAGAILFDECWLGKPLVYCGTGGIMPAMVNGRPSWEQSIEPGMLAVMVGGRVGKDGIHGATFSSLALDEGSPAGAVQIGDPIIQKRMGDFLLEARDRGYYDGITDNGAGGLSSSLGEMAESSGGIRIDLDACPRKYAGLSPWEVLVSESQERMSLAVRPESMPALLELAARRGVEATAIGEFTASGYVEASAGGKLVCRLSLDFLHRGLPPLRLPAAWHPLSFPVAPLPPESSAGALLLSLLAEPNAASKEAFVRQYDHEVKAISVEKPFTGLGRDAPSDGAVLKPRYDSWRGLTVTHGIAPRLSRLDPRLMAMAAVDEAYRAHIALGGDPDAAVALDNFCWPDPVEAPGNPDGAYKLGQLVRACEGLKEACLAYNLPLVSGKDSMKNDARVGGRRISIEPTLLVTLVGPVDDARKAPSTDFLAAGDLVYLVGATSGALGGSLLERITRAGKLPAAGSPAPLDGTTALAPGLGGAPDFEPARLLPAYKALARVISGRMARSCHDLSDGGLGLALAESCLGGRLGAELYLNAVVEGSWPEEELSVRALFAEDPGRILVSIRPEDRERFEASMDGRPVRQVGLVIAEPRLKARFRDRLVLDLGLAQIKSAFTTPIA
jgi:phosphoribosylformylglycinamidine synthase